MIAERMKKFSSDAARAVARTRSKRSNVTCIDIARMAGVATATVSRVINQSHRVSDDTRARVMDAIQATGYRPSVAASSLPRQKHDVIGLISDSGDDQSSYGPDLIRGVSMAAAVAGHRLSMSIINYHQPVDILEKLPLLRTIAADGLILDIHTIQGDIDAVVGRMRMPYVFVNAPNPRKYSTVMPDDLAVARQTTQYLIDRGHRKIAYLPSAQGRHSSHPLRMMGYSQAMMALGLPPGPLWDVQTSAGGFHLEEYVERVNLFRKEGMTGVVTYNAPTAAYFLRACGTVGVRVPDELSIISCDYDRILAYQSVPITSFHLDRIEMGEIAVKMLLRRIEHDGVDEPSVTMPAKLIEMESVRTLNA